MKIFRDTLLGEGDDVFTGKKSAETRVSRNNLTGEKRLEDATVPAGSRARHVGHVWPSGFSVSNAAKITVRARRPENAHSRLVHIAADESRLASPQWVSRRV